MTQRKRFEGHLIIKIEADLWSVEAPEGAGQKTEMKVGKVRIPDNGKLAIQLMNRAAKESYRTLQMGLKRSGAQPHPGALEILEKVCLEDL